MRCLHLLVGASDMPSPWRCRKGWGRRAVAVRVCVWGNSPWAVRVLDVSCTNGSYPEILRIESHTLKDWLARGRWLVRRGWRAAGARLKLMGYGPRRPLGRGRRRTPACSRRSRAAGATTKARRGACTTSQHAVCRAEASCRRWTLGLRSRAHLRTGSARSSRRLLRCRRWHAR